VIVRALAAALVLLACAARAADLFSPGELARPHAAYQGLANCTRCHPRGKQLSQEACLACHEEVKPSLDQNRGLHGRLSGDKRECWSCHHDHQGRDFSMIDWDSPSGRKGFDHARTGVPLKGKHLSVDCMKCHEARRIADAAVRLFLEKNPTRRTFLGAPAACAACHADEHRGQLGNDCKKCHGDAGFKPAPHFDHGKTDYALLGKHQVVACRKCHPKVEDRASYADLKPKRPTYLRMKPIRHESCLDCHKDPHKNRFGEDCAGCHTEMDWKTMVRGAKEVLSFHDKTRYKLEGAHAQVACQPCHGPFPGEKAVFRGVPFATCTDCHLDAHAGQMRRTPGGAKCDRCHTLEAFEIPRFGTEEHQQTRYPLEGAHRITACALCHQSDPRVAERLPRAARAEIVRRGRPIRLSLGVYLVSGNLPRCETCHADPHGGQFDKKAGSKGCTACHELSSFSRTRFDHARDTKFPLQGKHAKTACASCHPASAGPLGQSVVKYTGVAITCAGCHADPHGAQFPKALSDPNDCARCHGADDWKKTLRFRHEPPFTDFTLEGKHRKAECRTCHPEIKLADAKLSRYRGVPRTCQGCHADFHKGAFRGFEP
jgi:hypothetical protein